MFNSYVKLPEGIPSRFPKYPQMLDLENDLLIHLFLEVGDHQHGKRSNQVQPQ